MSSFAIAVVGTGFIGPVHVEALRRAGQGVRGILGSSPDKSRKAASALRLPQAYETFEQILEDREVGAVHITAPNRHHFSLAKQALEAGKHVLCEKPLAMTSHDSAELVKAAAKSQRAAGVAYNIRYYPLCQEAAARVKGGELGRVFHVSGAYVQDWLLKETDFNWRVTSREGGELRAVGDIGTHWLDLIQFITGQKISAVCADLHTVHPVRYAARSQETFSEKLHASEEPREPQSVDTEDYAAILFQFAGGARGSLHVSQVTAGRKNCLRFELAGQAGALSWNSETPNEMWLGQRDAPNQSILRDPALLSKDARRFADYPGGHNEGFPDTFKQLFKDFYGSIAAGTACSRPTFPTFADGHYEILLCEAILASQRGRCWIDVKEPNQ